MIVGLEFLLALSMELEKLVAFVFPAKELTVEDVTACIGDLHRYDAFDLAEALGQRNRQRALSLLRRVFTNDNEALRILHALVAHFRRLWQVKDLLMSGVTRAELATSSARTSTGSQSPGPATGPRRCARWD